MTIIPSTLRQSGGVGMKFLATFYAKIDWNLTNVMCYLYLFLLAD
jgi:hypothetical protein